MPIAAEVTYSKEPCTSSRTNRTCAVYQPTELDFKINNNRSDLTGTNFQFHDVMETFLDAWKFIGNEDIKQNQFALCRMPPHSIYPKSIRSRRTKYTIVYWVNALSEPLAVIFTYFKNPHKDTGIYRNENKYQTIFRYVI